MQSPRQGQENLYLEDNSLYVLLQQ